MARNPESVHEKQRASEVRKAMAERGVHHIPVVSGSRFIGLITANDLLRVSWGDTNVQDARTIDALLDTLSIRDVMNEDVITIAHDATVREAAEKLAQGSYHSLPVVDGEDLVGIVTSTDLIRYLVEQY